MRPAKLLKESLCGGVAVLLTIFGTNPNAQANVYASNVKLNGALSSVTNAAGSPVTISYILNQPATLGTTINILSGTNAVDTISIASGSIGTLMGTNSVVWGGTNSAGADVPGGTYSVSITAAASGFTNWTQITSDTNPGNYVYWPAGIAVDCNTNSLYYGRIMVANSGPNDSGTNFGDTNGVLKLNADGSFADEGQGNAGYAFDYDGFNGDIPRRGRIGADDRFYFNDWSGNGKIVAVDMLMTTNQVIVDSANFTGTAANGDFSEIDITDVGTTNARAYFSDFNPGGIGVWVWAITNNGAANVTNNGTQVIAPGGTDIPARSVYGLMLDESADIFIGDVQTSATAEPRATCITNWPSSPNQPLTNNNVLWAVGTNDSTFDNISDLAIDSRTSPHYVACPMSSPGAGGLRILSATNGSLIANIQQSNSIYFLSAGWDNVGNVYAGTSSNVWRAFSPPGTNQATTVAVETIQMSAPPPPPAPIITSITESGGTVTIDFTGPTNDTASSFTLLGSATVIPASSYTAVPGASISVVSPGVFVATVPANSSIQYYRVVVSSPHPIITGISVSGGTVTINFTGTSSDSPSSFTLMSSATDIPASSYTAAAGAIISQVSPGVFTATVATNGSAQFYRVAR